MEKKKETKKKKGSRKSSSAAQEPPANGTANGAAGTIPEDEVVPSSTSSLPRPESTDKPPANGVGSATVGGDGPAASAPAEEEEERGRDYSLKKRGWRSNSTNSLYIRETLNAPDENALVRCMAVSARKIFEYSLKHPAKPRYPKKAYVVFETPLSKSSPPPELPSIEELTRFIQAIVEAGDLAPQSCVLFVLFLGRLKDRMPLTAMNWRRVVLSSLILGCKVWEDEAVWNSDFEQLFPQLDNKTLGQLEKQLLTVLGYHVTMKASEYAECFFAMKELVPNALPEKPLSAQEVKRLEERSAKTEAEARNEKPVSRSVDINSKGHVVSPPPMRHQR